MDILTVQLFYAQTTCEKVSLAMPCHQGINGFIMNLSQIFVTSQVAATSI